MVSVPDNTQDTDDVLCSDQGGASTLSARGADTSDHTPETLGTHSPDTPTVHILPLVPEPFAEGSLTPRDSSRDSSSRPPVAYGEVCDFCVSPPSTRTPL